MSEKVIIDKKYVRKENKGEGYSSKVYIVEEIKTKKIYAAKIFNSHTDFFYNEVEMLEKLKDKNLQNIINIIEHGDGDIVKGYSYNKKQYIILEYAQKGDLSKFIKIPKKPFKEKHAKLLFTKIVKAVKSIHENGICHRDLKTGNILLDENFNIKICDFGFSTYIQDNLNDVLGTKEYMAPEIHENKKYSGVKADIFALGVILFQLTNGIYCFTEATKNNEPYKYIRLGSYDTFWKKIQIDDLSPEFKKLYEKMVSYKTEERPSINEILENKWMKIDEKEIESIELEIYEDFLDREKIIKDSTDNKILIVSDDDNSEISYDYSFGTRSLKDENKEYFNNTIIPRVFVEGKYLEYYIKIYGKLNPAKFMNYLTNKLEKDKSEYSCEINECKYRLKFQAIFNPIKNEEDENNDEKEEGDGIGDNSEIEEKKNFIRESEIKIDIELFESGEKEYILRYKKRSGEKDHYYQILFYLNNCIEEIIKNK